jgi:hypothetical protein
VSITLSTMSRRLRELNRGEITRCVRREIDKPLPIVRARVKASALGKLPKSGGLAAWAAAAHLTAQVTTSGETVTAHLKVHRTSLYRPSDLRALDRGRVRHPSWGHRSSNAWHIQLVTPKVYSEPIAESPEWRRAITHGVDRALDVLRHG